MNRSCDSSSSSRCDKQEEKNTCAPHAPPNHSQSNSSERKSRRKQPDSDPANNQLQHSIPHRHISQYDALTEQQQQQMNADTKMTRDSLLRASRVSINSTVASLVLKSVLEKLPYKIHSYSSYSGVYHPHHIYVNKPTEQSSRWSSGSHDHEQFITIEFDEPVVARSITFGKFHKGHVCNLKEFRIYGGLHPNEDMIELLHDGLKNDTEAETFSLKHQYKDLVFPIKYIKIVPLSAFGANFNYSIWYIEVKGIMNNPLMHRVCTEYDNYKELETTRLCLKYFRQKNMMDVFHALQKRTNIELEHQFLSDLHRYLVVESDFEAAEDVLRKAHQRQVYQSYCDDAKYVHSWKQIQVNQKDNEVPSPRGGHQMCIDAQNRKIYVFGGWDGKQDLADFWSYDLRLEKWELISANTQLQGGPSPRSCHKICFDPASRSIFVLGRYLDPQTLVDQEFESDFYRYYIEFDQWVKIQDNTASHGGPELIYDHQMCADPVGEVLYVFGGRTVTADANIQSYSGLYAYHLATDRWELLRSDGLNLPSNLRSRVSSFGLKSRVGHSMLFDETRRSLYVFAGERVKDYLSDLYRYDVLTDVITEIVQDASKDAGPDAGFTQRATMDEELQELYIFSGYLRNPGTTPVKNSLWVYSIRKNEWQKLYENEGLDKSVHQPCPRFAHQMVYDPITKAQYVFGGNPGDNANPSRRLNDFWELKLSKPDPSEILRKSLFELRIQKLKELCSRACEEQHDKEAIGNNPHIFVALEYLRNQVTPVVNHDDETESKVFRQLCATLCVMDNMTDGNTAKDKGFFNIIKSDDALYTERTLLFEKLLEYIPQDMKEPSGSLTNAVRLY